MSNDEKTLTQEEMWQIRALEAQEGRLKAEIQLAQNKLENINKETQMFVLKLKEKYGAFSAIRPDGLITYPDKEAEKEPEETTDKEK